MHVLSRKKLNREAAGHVVGVVNYCPVPFFSLPNASNNQIIVLAYLDFGSFTLLFLFFVSGRVLVAQMFFL